MIKTWLTPYYSFNNLSIYDFGEETEAVIKPNPIMQRSYFLIHFIVSGEGTYTIKSASGERTVPLQAGDVFAIYPYDFIQYRSNPKNPMHYFWVNFNGNEGENILEHIKYPLMRIFNSKKLSLQKTYCVIPIIAYGNWQTCSILATYTPFLLSSKNIAEFLLHNTKKRLAK